MADDNIWDKVKDRASEMKNNISKAHSEAKKNAYTPSEHVRGYIAAFFRTFGFILLSIGLGLIFQTRPIIKMVPLFLLAFAMLTYPDDISGGRPRGEDIGLAMFKVLLGITLAGMFISTFWTGLNAPGRFSWLLVSFSALAIGFFVMVIPENLGRSEEGVLQVNVAIADTGGKLGDYVVKIIMFGILAPLILYVGIGVATMVMGSGIVPSNTAPAVLAALFSGGSIVFGGILMGKINEIGFSFCVFVGLLCGAIGLSGTALALIMFMSIVFIGALGGLPVADARPILGIPILIIALTAATAAYPSIMGQAVFGQWWEPVYAQIQGVQKSMSPLLKQIRGVSTPLGRGWSCLKSPTQCYKRYNKPETQVSKTYRALAVNQIKATGLGSIRKPPKSYGGTVLLSTLEVENRLDANKVDNPPTIKNVNISTHKIYDAINRERTFKGPQDKVLGDNPYIKGGGCHDWVTLCKNGTEYGPGMKARYTINISSDRFYRNIGPNNYLKYGVDITYPITTHSVLDVEVMNKDRFNRLMKKDEIDFENPTSTYEWGPVSVAIGVGQQPAQAHTTVPLVVYIKNRGKGYLKEITGFKIENVTPGLTSQDDISSCQRRFSNHFKDELNKSIKKWRKDRSEGGGSLSAWGVPPKKKVSGQCLIDLKKVDVNRKTFGLTATLNYTYQLKRTDTVEVMYECNGKSDCGEDEWCNLTHGMCVLKDKDCTQTGCPSDMKCNKSSGYCRKSNLVFTHAIPSEYDETCEDYCSERGYECNDSCESCVGSPSYWDKGTKVYGKPCKQDKYSRFYNWYLGCCCCENE